MRMATFVNSFKTALILAPLLASCGGAVNSSPAVIGPGGLTLPDCLEGQLIGVNPDKTLTCVSAVTGMLSPPTCTPGTQALTSAKDAVSGNNVLSCVNKGTGSMDVATTTRITNATTNVNNLQTQVNLITVGGGNRGKYVGKSSTTSKGAVFAPASATNQGAQAAALVCSVDYPGSHLCSPYEIYETVVTATAGGLLDGSVDVGPLMVYQQAWVPPFAAGGTEPNAGLSENCGSETYPTADRKWHNTFFSFTIPAGSTVRVPQFDSNQGCSTPVALACCK